MSSPTGGFPSSPSDRDREHQQRVLEVFTQAPNWRRYLSRVLKPFVSGDVLEVGAGLGANTFGLASLSRRSWTCLEPDPALATEAERALRESELPLYATIVVGTIEDLAEEQCFDAVIYLDVLEHIQEDARQLLAASEHLNPGGRIVVLSPAHQWLFSPFDAALGHLRRYDRQMLRQIAPPGLSCERLAYLDSVSLAVFGVNKLLLQQSMPTPRQIRLWDRFLVPPSRVLDPLLGYRAGKTILCVWRRSEAPREQGPERTVDTGPNAGR